jgi:hypothetical protein
VLDEERQRTLALGKKVIASSPNSGRIMANQYHYLLQDPKKVPESQTPRQVLKKLQPRAFLMLPPRSS